MDRIVLILLNPSLTNNQGPNKTSQSFFSSNGASLNHKYSERSKSTRCGESASVNWAMIIGRGANEATRQQFYPETYSYGSGTLYFIVVAIGAKQILIKLSCRDKEFLSISCYFLLYNDDYYDCDMVLTLESNFAKSKTSINIDLVVLSIHLSFFTKQLDIIMMSTCETL